MKNMVQFTLTLIVAALVLASLASADVPQLMNYQGRLTDSAGMPLDTTVSMTFTIYNDLAAGSSKWTETQPSVTVTDGLFNVILGGVNPILDSVFNDTGRYLGVQVGTDPELSPRTRLISVGYSHRVSTVDGASGGTISGDVDIQSDLTVSGNVGIGSTNPSEQLEVAGTVYSTSGGFKFPDGSLQSTAASSAPVARTEWLSPFWNDQGAQYYTFISVYNAGTTSNQFTITFYSLDGLQIAQCVQLFDTAQVQVWTITTPSAGFGNVCSPFASGQGHLIISAQEPVAVWGFVRFNGQPIEMIFYAP